MVSIMGAPPPEFLERSEKSQLFWNTEGNATDRRGKSRILEDHEEQHEVCINYVGWCYIGR
jgi:hypothetical protein